EGTEVDQAAMPCRLTDPGNALAPINQHVRGGQVLDPQKMSQAEVDAFLERVVQSQENGHLQERDPAGAERADLVFAEQLHLGQAKSLAVVLVFLLEFFDLRLQL